MRNNYNWSILISKQFLFDSNKASDEWHLSDKMKKLNYDDTWLEYANALNNIFYTGVCYGLIVWVLCQGHLFKDVINF